MLATCVRELRKSKFDIKETTRGGQGKNRNERRKSEQLQAVRLKLEKNEL